MARAGHCRRCIQEMVHDVPRLLRLRRRKPPARSPAPGTDDPGALDPNTRPACISEKTRRLKNAGLWPTS